ncbi:DUF6069 family protein [Spirilliplanes yamanashiensis]|uniref:Uncharacterized protein n=1 Tax=Spirilliplanes yamanashiensis TaxID=42233 RepID=A0A8J3YDQ0_9ACTN|nr:DUF6069 family protein [Spirilliplanes yamanashiensis]MDP9816662.1 hypothetical protein [Spirilliplanes yamanashiensis]GIJ06184.1 hypothetical protein Sya03_55360 [Spirilliplanes yamanashiensis]
MTSTIATPARRGLAATGAAALLTAVAATALAATLARAAGVHFQIPAGGETIPTAGFAVVTAFFSAVGIAVAAGYRRWSTRPADRFLWTAVSLAALSLIPPVLSGAAGGTVVALVALHLVPAAVMIPALTYCLSGAASRPASPE